MDATEVIRISRHNGSNKPVTTARYIVEFVMNEELPDEDASPQEHIERFSDAIQDALDADVSALTQVRYDACIFEVVSREVLDIAPAGDPE